MKLTPRLALRLLITLLLSSCASPTPLRQIDPKADSLKGTVWVLDYDFPTPDRLSQSDTCQFVFLKLESKEGFTLNLPLHQKQVAAALEPGRYMLRRIYCGEAADWRFYDKPFVIQAVADKINYWGGFMIVEDESSQGLHIQWIQASHMKQSPFARELSDDDRKRLVSAHNGKAIFP